MLKIAFILPSLANRGPVLVARDLSSGLNKLGHSCTVFYFDQLEAIDFEVPVKPLTYKQPFDFSGFDIVHSHGLRPDYFVYKNRHMIKAACLSTMHNIIIEEYRALHSYAYAWLVQFMWTRFLKRHDALVCLNWEMKTYYRRFFREKPIDIVYNGRNLNPGLEIPAADLEEISRFKKDLIILGSACLVSKRKGLHQVINALPEMPGYGFILIGDGPELQALQEQAMALGVADRCLFPGERKDAHRYYPYFDLFIMASYAEGMPLALLEAAAMRIPAICSNIEVLREILGPEETCFFEPDDTEGFVKAVETVLSSHGQYAEKLNQLYTTKFTGEAMTRGYEAVYRKLNNENTSA